MDRLKSCTPDQRTLIISELQSIGCCDLCVLRYLGIVDSDIYNNEATVRHLVNPEFKNGNIGLEEDVKCSDSKLKKMNPCTACLGLLEDGIKEDWLDKIVEAVKESQIETMSYCPSLSLPTCIQIRAYSIWFYLKTKFPDVYSSNEDLKPDGTPIKSVWKFVAADKLRRAINPDSEWTTTGTTSVQITATYTDDREESLQLENFLLNVRKIKKRRDVVSKGTVESTFHKMSTEDFVRHFKSPPSIPTQIIRFASCECSHSSIFVAGRYRKYSRTLSQTPWVLDGVRKTESSVEELISDEIVAFLQAGGSKFLSSGREDVDVRTLGRGRPFAVEVLTPKRTIFTAQRMTELQDKINSSTKLISVNSIQIVDKKELSILKHGEETKSKTYCALCSTLGTPVTPEMMEILNNLPLPLVLTQRTPIRVLHRRSSSARSRSIYALTASIVPGHSDIFKLNMTTQAGTYVKEFVHGDFGRTVPNVSDLLGVDADIFALDVDEVNLDWPPAPVKTHPTKIEAKVNL